VRDAHARERQLSLCLHSKPSSSGITRGSTTSPFACSNPQNAEDATQEILIKVLTRLSSFEGRSSFRTWLYRR